LLAILLSLLFCITISSCDHCFSCAIFGCCLNVNVVVAHHLIP
jgi:hypothetical protein